MDGWTAGFFFSPMWITQPLERVEALQNKSKGHHMISLVLINSI
jgi:hypothetical protein